MFLVGARQQQVRDFTFDASGTITSGGTAQLLLAESKSRSAFFFQNISSSNMFLEFGSARATATLTNGAVTSVSVTNSGFGFTLPPTVLFYGGGNLGWNNSNPTFLGGNQPGYQNPQNMAVAKAVLSGSSVGSITVYNGGSGYVTAPYVFLHNQLNDPFGCATPSATVGILIPANGGSYMVNGTSCSTDPISVFCASSSAAFTCKWMP